LWNSVVELTCEVVVVGAGPAGSAAAAALSAAGRDVILIDREAFPRDKTCGDALIPDALKALEQLGLARSIRAAARSLDSIEVYSPDRTSVRIQGEVACLPRSTFDDFLKQNAVGKGAKFMAPYTFTGILKDGNGAVVGVNTTAASGAEVRIRSTFVLLATGAHGSTLERAGVCTRKTPSGIAARAYFRNHAIAESMSSLIISFDGHIRPGYGWIFPGPQGVLNVGVGYFSDGRKRSSSTNVRTLFDAFIGSFPLAQRVVASSMRLTDLKGAPLRTSLSGSALAVPGLLVIGEAAGATYSFSGEGIGKALETAAIASNLIVRCFARDIALADVHARYRDEIEQKLASRFATYKVAQDWLAHPWLCNFLARRAKKPGYVLDRLEAMLAETEDPKRLFSWLGFVKALAKR
jgi:geranylgeranyl reductase family protein